MRENREKFIDRTIEFWQSRTSMTLDREDARQIIQNISGFFQILSEWQATTTEDNTPQYVHALQKDLTANKRATNE